MLNIMIKTLKVDMKLVINNKKKNKTILKLIICIYILYLILFFFYLPSYIFSSSGKLHLLGINGLVPL